MRRLVLLCLAGSLMTAAVAVAAPLVRRPAASSWFATSHDRRAPSARTRVTRAQRHLTPHRVASSPTASAATDPVLFGDQAIESARDDAPAGLPKTFAFSNTSTGFASSIVVYLSSWNKAKTLVTGLYADQNGSPGALVAFGSLRSPRAGAWNSVNISSTSIQPGTYWLAVLGEGGTLHFRDRSNGPCDSQTANQGNLAALPSSWPAGPIGNACPISAYVDGTLSAGAPGVTLPPANDGAPTITGSAVDGDTLTASNGTWANGPTSYAYQWQDCTTGSLGLVCTNVSGATSRTYALTLSDVGETVRVLVTAANSAGSTSVASAQTSAVTLPPAPANTALPTLSGSPVQGQALSTSNGTWSNNPQSYSYAWEDCDGSGNNCTTITNATGSSYTLTSSDVGQTVRSVVTASNANGSNAARSAPTAIVTVPAPTSTAAPTVAGSTVQGQTLTTNNGSWTGNPTSYSYAWEDCNSSGGSCSNIAGAASSSYALAAGDVGHTVRAAVTATNVAGSASATSGQTAVVQSSGSTTALLGDQSPASYADNNPAGMAQAFTYSASASGTTTDIDLYVNTGATATKLLVGLYSDASGAPGTLLSTGSLSSPQAGAWNDVPVSSTTITQGTSYWIAVLGTGGVLNYLDTSGGTGASYVNSATGLTSLPSTYSPGHEYNVSPASAYVNGVPSSGGAGSPAAPSSTGVPLVSGTRSRGRR